MGGNMKRFIKGFLGLIYCLACSFCVIVDTIRWFSEHIKPDRIDSIFLWVGVFIGGRIFYTAVIDEDII
jgi:prolipoprotein diacylglyceryltransferase